jgi:hypothetical protein
MMAIPMAAISGVEGHAGDICKRTYGLLIERHASRQILTGPAAAPLGRPLRWQRRLGTDPVLILDLLNSRFGGNLSESGSIQRAKKPGGLI